MSNAIDGTERWWQSPPLSRGLEYNEVNVTLDLGQVGFILSGQLQPQSLPWAQDSRIGEVTIGGDHSPA